MKRALVLFVVLTGCNPFGPADFSGLTLDLRVNPHIARPGTNVAVTAIAYLPAEQRLSKLRLRLNGFGGQDSVDLPIVGPGPHGYAVELRLARLPIEGEVSIDLLAQLGAEYDSVRRTFTVADDGPPTLTASTAPTVDPPDSIALEYLAIDSSGLVSLAFHVRGAVQLDTVLLVADTAIGRGGVLRMAVPESVPLGDSMIVDLVVTDIFAKETTRQFIVAAQDRKLPVLQVAVDTIVHGAGVNAEVFPFLFVPGDTMRVRVTATDRRGIARVGYRWLQFGDSMAVSGDSASASFWHVTPPDTTTTSAITVFAVDSNGNRAEVWSVAYVVNAMVRPVSTIVHTADSLLVHDERGGAVIDAARERMYLAAWQNRVAVFSLAPLAGLPPLQVDTSVRAVDLTPGGDTLIAWVGHYATQPNRLFLWDVTGAPTPIDTVPVSLPGACSAWDMGVAANGLVFVTATPSCPTMDVNLLTGVQRERRPGITECDVVCNIEVSGDRRRFLQWDRSRAAVYRSETDSLGGFLTLFAPSGSGDAYNGPSLDFRGAVTLMRNRLYDSTFAAYRLLLPEPLPARAHAVSADGAKAFVGGFPGYWRVNVATGVVEERVFLPHGAVRLMVHPAGDRLIVFAGAWTSVVDLR